MSYIQVFLFSAVLVMLATLVSLRRAHIRVEYSVSWLGVGFILFVLSFFPRLLVRVAANVGVEPQICFLFVAGALLLALLFEVSHVVSQLRDENVVLIQKMAILEYHLNRLQAGLLDGLLDNQTVRQDGLLGSRDGDD